MELDQQVSKRALALRASPERVAGGVNPHVDRIFSRRIDMGVTSPKPEIVEIAETYHALYQRQSEERRRELDELYEQLGRPADVIVMLYCRKFLPFFENWLASCDSHGIDVRGRLMPFVLDTEAAAKTRELGVACYCLDPAYYGEAGGSAAYGDRKFSRTMFYKNAIVLEMLELGANVLFQDVDLVWLRDPFAYLHEEGRLHDLCFMYDGANKAHRPIYANTGFIYVCCTEASKAFFDTALCNTASVFGSGSHQAPLNRMLAHFVMHNVLGVRVLPQALFLNGHLFNLQRGVAPSAGDWEQEGYVVHYSWTANTAQKLEKIEKFGFNYLPDDRLRKMVGN